MATPGGAMRPLNVRCSTSRDVAFEVAEGAPFNDIYEAAAAASGYPREGLAGAHLVVCGHEEVPCEQALQQPGSVLIFCGISPYVSLTVHSLSQVAPEHRNLKYKLVWRGLGERGQTAQVEPDSEGVVAYGRAWCLSENPEAAERALSIAVWVTPPGGAEDYLGLANVAVADFASTPRQIHAFDMTSADGSQKVHLRFSLVHHPAAVPSVAEASSAAPVQESGAASPASRRLEEAEAEARAVAEADAEAGRHMAATEGVESVERAAIADRAVQEKPATEAASQSRIEVTPPEPAPSRGGGGGGGGASPSSAANPPAFAPASDGRLSTAELRVWIADILSEVRSGMGESYLHENANPPHDIGQLHDTLEIYGSPVQWGDTVVQILGEPVLRAGHMSSRRTIVTTVAEERLISAALEVYLNSTDWGPDIALSIRQRASESLLSLLNLPASMAYRSFGDNGLATSAVLHQIQRCGFLKAHGVDSLEDIVTRTCPAMSVYVGQESYEEWGSCDILKQLLWEMPSVEVKCAASNADGSINVTALQAAVAEDVAKGVVPVAVVARMGSDGFEGADDIASVAQVCLQHKLWLHVEGPGVFLLHNKDSPASAALLQAAHETDLNISIVLCAHEYPALRRVQGFWVFSSGRCGVELNPQDKVPETDVAALPCSLPAYLRLRSSGLAAVDEGLTAKMRSAERAVEVLHGLGDAAGEGCGVIVPQMHTSRLNLFAASFTLLPRDHPLVAQGGAGEGECKASTATINTVNKSVCELLGDPRFTIIPDQGEGLVRWHVSPTTLSDDVMQRFSSLVSTTAAEMLCISSYTGMVSDALSKLDSIAVVPPAEAGTHSARQLCALRLVPPFCEDADRGDEGRSETTVIQANFAGVLQEEANAAGAPVRFEAAGDEVLCLLREGAGSLSDANIATIQEATKKAVAHTLRTDPVILRLEADVLQRGIAVAQKKLEEAAKRQETQTSMIRSIPLVGSMFGWMSPESPSEEGLKFDLTTSTLRKEVKN